MKKVFIFFVLLFNAHILFSTDKTLFDLKSTSLLKSINGFGCVQTRNKISEITMLSGGYFTIGTTEGVGAGSLDDNCGITFGHPYAMSSYPIFSLFSLLNGNFICLWWSSDGDDWGIYGQRYSSNETKIGEEFRVNSYTSGYQNSPKVLVFPGGKFLITWVSRQQDGSADGIYAQLYDSNLQPVGDEFRVNTYTNGNQNNQHLVLLKNGNFVICWQSDDQVASGTSIYAQLFTPECEKIGYEFRVPKILSYEQKNPQITVLDNSDYIICWLGREEHINKYLIYAKRFTQTTQIHPLNQFKLTFPPMDASFDRTKIQFIWRKASNLPIVYPWEIEY